MSFLAKATCSGCSRWIRCHTASADSGSPESIDAGSRRSIPKGRSVSSRMRRMRRRISSGGTSVSPVTPSPPALDTAATSSGGATAPCIPPIPASRIGYLMPSRSHSGVWSSIAC